LEKIAVIELKTTGIKLQIVDVIRNKYYQVHKTIEMPVNLTKDFYSDYFVKPAIIKQLNGILAVYKRIIEKYECTETIGLATDFLEDAKNINGLLNELAVTNGINFKVFNANDETNSIYTAVINSFNRPKGLIINVTDYNTELIIYNRRNIINKLIIPYGTVKLYNSFDNKTLDEKQVELSKIVKEMIGDNNFLADLPEEYDVIGCGEAFKDYGIVCRKAKKYPIELAHNFISNKTDFEKVYGLVRNFDSASSTKIKGLTLDNSKYFPSGMAIIKAVFENIEKDEFCICKLGRADGILFNTVLPLTIEKPMSDTLGYSLQALNDYYDLKPNNSLHIYELSMILFKQLKVLHKLSRPYVKVLRIASYLSNCGYRIDVDNEERAVFDVIKNTEVYGVSHNDVIMAGFVALGKNPDNFNLSEWVKYKEYLTEEDLMAVKKLSVILRIAESLDITGFNNVVDISCDILGDSVIMKTIVNEESQFEINAAMLCGSDFKKVFGKNLEVL